MSKKDLTIKERLIRIEVMLSNHLKHHTYFEVAIAAPIVVGLVLFICKLIFGKIF